MASMNLNQILNTASHAENHLMQLATQDAEIGRDFGNTQCYIAGRLKGKIDQSVELSRREMTASAVFTGLSGAISGIAGLGAGGGLAASSSRFTEGCAKIADRVQTVARTVVSPLVNSAAGASKAVFAKEKADNTEEQAQYSNELKVTGSAAGDSVGIASDLVDDRASVAGNLLQAIKNEGNAGS